MPPALMLYDTFTRARQRVRQPKPGRPITLYVCGPTVYGRAHIGNARPAVVFDVLYRLLRHLHGAEHVRYARNITDIDDKIMAIAVKENVDPQVVAARYEGFYVADMAALGCLTPDFTPRATDHIAGEHGMVAMIAALVARGFAYHVDGHVLFEVSKFDRYGELSRRPMDEMIAGARVEVAPYKRAPADFILWKPSLADQPGWDSPWGRGRPGWHIECSAMIRSVLETETIDIHGGGLDLTFPHHENERAQSCCAHDGAELSRIWMHNGFLNMGETKMSKSLGNIVTPRELLDAGWDGEVLRLALLSAHYRQPLLWSDDLIYESKRRLDRLYRFRGYDSDMKTSLSGVVDSLADDLATPDALAELSHQRDRIRPESHTLMEQAKLQAGGSLLGLLKHSTDQWFQASARGLHSIDPDLIERHVARIEALRAEKNWAAADGLRDELRAKGIEISAARDGSVTWRKA